MNTGVGTLKRVSVMAVVAALVVVSVQFSSAPANAAPVTCTGTVRVFDGRADGSMYYYEHRAPATGDFSWTVGRLISVGFTGPTAASTDGTLYFVTSGGDLRRYRYDGTRWDNGGVVIGTGWQGWHGNRRNPLTVDTKGRLYTVDQFGTLLMYDQTVSPWDAGKGIPLQYGWAGARVVAAGDGVLYRIDMNGALSRYRYDADAQRLLSPAAPVGSGWQIFDQVFSPGGDVLYGTYNNNLYWYRYDADTGSWANNGYWRQVGSGWANRLAVSAVTSTCSIPATPAVAPVTPVAGSSTAPLQLSGNGGAFSYAYLDAQGRAVEARDNGDALTRTVLAGRTFAGDLSAATSRDPANTEELLGVDASGALWLAEGVGEFGPWQPFGKGMRRAVLTEAFAPSDPVQALAVDGAGGLWWRMRPAPYHRWMPWQLVARSVSDFSAAAAAPGGLYGVAGADWFTFERTGDTVRVQRDRLPADFDAVVPAETTALPATFFARQTSTGAPVSWGPLPQLPSSVTVRAPVTATQIGQDRVAVALLASDDNVYVTAGSPSTGAYDPWQRVGGKAATGPQLVAGSTVELAFAGQDGRLYHFTAPVSAGPLVFTGKGR